MNISQISRITGALVTGGTTQAKYSATSPQNLLDVILNFFTFGSVRRSNTRKYDEVMLKLASELVHSCDEKGRFPENFYIEHEGVVVNFTVPLNVSRLGYVTVEITDGKTNLRNHIDYRKFKSICNVLWIRETFNLGHEEDPLTPNGMMNFRFVDLSEKDMSGLVFDSPDFTGSDLSDSNLNNSRFMNGCLKSINMRRANCTDLDLSGSDCSDADFTDTCFKRVVAVRTDFTRANLSRCNTKNGEFIGSCFDYANMVSLKALRAHFTASSFRNANMEKADFEEAHFWLIDGSRANCRGANFESANFTFALMGNTDFRESTHNRTIIFKSTFSDALLDHANGAGIRIISSNFQGVSAKGAIFDGAKIANDTLIELCKKGGIVLKKVEGTGVDFIDLPIKSEGKIKKSLEKPFAAKVNSESVLEDEEPYDGSVNIGLLQND